jgi:hypothetical protein
MERFSSARLRTVLRSALQAAVTDLTAYRRQQSKTLGKRKTELATKQDRLLNAYVADTNAKGTPSFKSTTRRPAA